MTESLRNILSARDGRSGGPFMFNKKEAYYRIKNILNLAAIPNASPHTLRKTAGAWYLKSTRDIFATKEFLGHSDVKITSDYYVGLLQSMKTEYSESFEKTLVDSLK